jgi:hypothetical protein
MSAEICFVRALWPEWREGPGIVPESTKAGVAEREGRADYSGDCGVVESSCGYDNSGTDSSSGTRGRGTRRSKAHGSGPSWPWNGRRSTQCWHSGVFESKPRMASLLRYICERHFEGDIDAIKEYSIATDVFGRSHSFDPATDSIVRVEVFRLRKRLREFYGGEGANQPIEIVVATGHYRPEFVDRISSIAAHAVLQLLDSGLICG